MTSAPISNSRDTQDRYTTVNKEIADIKANKSDSHLRYLVELLEENQKLTTELASGKYFAKSSDIFPRADATVKKLEHFEGKAQAFQRKNKLDAYGEQRSAFIKHLTDDENGSLPDCNSLVASEASGTSHNKEGMDPKACIIRGKAGHKAYLGSDSSNCSPFWALVYEWMIGTFDELETLVRKIENTNTDSGEKLKLKDRLWKALMMLSVGSNGGTKGMRSDIRNILFVPEPHSPYYEDGCNWVIFPIMTANEMTDWKGESYEVAIFTGQTVDEIEGKKNGDIWNETASKFTAEQAEKLLFNELFINQNDKIDICSTADLRKVGESLEAMGLALADLHTRTSSDSNFKARIIDLASTVRQYLVEMKLSALKVIREEIQKSAPDNYFDVQYVQHKLVPLKQFMDDLDMHAQRQGMLDQIEAGINHLILRLQQDGIAVPALPTKNYFGADGKHVFKTKIPQKFPPDPIVLAAKGTNNHYRQWGMRLLPGCRCNDSTSDDSSSSSSFVDGGEAISAATTPMTPYKDFRGSEIFLDREGVDEDNLSICSDLSG